MPPRLSLCIVAHIFTKGNPNFFTGAYTGVSPTALWINKGGTPCCIWNDPLPAGRRLPCPIRPPHRHPLRPLLPACPPQREGQPRPPLPPRLPPAALKTAHCPVPVRPWHSPISPCSGKIPGATATSRRCSGAHCSPASTFPSIASCRPVFPPPTRSSLS